VAAAFIMLLLFAPSAMARLSGEASLDYTSYDWRASNSRNLSYNSLTQNYSLLYSTKGQLKNARIGAYDLSLGYNWTSLDTTVKSSTQSPENYKASRGHILFKGEVTIDPKEVPLKLNIYSRDMNRNVFSTSYARNTQGYDPIFGYGTPATGINNGIHIESGATLIAGVKNGMTNGYNEILRHFPMILVDYKDVINRDMRADNQVNDRLSRLAFVSLNKKDNWFHYRHTQYSDYLNSMNNYTENEIQLGTVDQQMARRWIDFSNWLSVSTDLQFSKRKSNYQTNPIEDINLNLFATAERQSWNARTFSTFNRHRDENSRLSYQTTLPLYVSGIFSKDVSWNARTSLRDNNDIDILGVRSSFTSALAGYRVDAFKQSHFTLSQGFDVESTKSNNSDLLMLSGSIETTSTPFFSRTVSFGASYNVRNSILSKGNQSSSDFFEQRIALYGGYTPINTLRFNLRQNNTITKGNNVQLNTNVRDSSTLLPQYVGPENLSSTATGSESYNSVTTFSVAWNPRPRLNTSLTLIEDIYRSDVVNLSTRSEVHSDISYTSDSWSFTDTFRYNRGDRNTLDNNADTVSNTATARYVHSRNLDASASASYSEIYSDRALVASAVYEQRANYYFLTNTGVLRRLLEFNEILRYASGNGNDLGKSLSLGLRYYPIRQLTLAGGVGYSYANTIRDYTLVWNASVVANFRLLQASFDYVSGIRKLDGVRENKLTGSIRRSF
jgi:hypothetical protein